MISISLSCQKEDVIQTDLQQNSNFRFTLKHLNKEQLQLNASIMEKLKKLEPNTSMYRWFVVGASLVWGVSPGQYGVDLMEEDYTADVPFSPAQINNANVKPRTSTSNCN
ncbi:MAG: hypothetical protein ACSHXF_01605 [Aquaticitalea sp.]